MTLKITKSKVCVALIFALCVLVAIFAAVAAKSRTAFADEADGKNRAFDFVVSDFVDYNGREDNGDEDGEIGEEAPNRLWLLQVGSGAVALGDQTAYTVENDEVKATVEGELYNSYVCYNGQAQTIVLNDEYLLNGKPLGEYFALENAVYADNTATGEINKANEITTTVRLYVDGTPEDGAEGDFAYDQEKDAWYIQLEKVWYIVTFNNDVRMYNGTEAAVEGWSYGDDVSAMTPLRPEHGDVAVFEIGKSEYSDSGESVNVVSMRFAVLYGEGIRYYETTDEDGEYAIDLTKPLDDDYYTAALAAFDAGNYMLKVTVPDYTADNARRNWWDNGVSETDGAVFSSVTRTFGFVVDPYVLQSSLDDNADITIEIVDDKVVFNNSKDNVPEALVKFRGVTLVKDVDYMLTSEYVNAGDASFDLVGYGNFEGTIVSAGEYKIVSGTNSWKYLPNIMQWTYGNYDKQVNLITAEPLYDYKSNSGLWFSITTDKLGTNYASPALAEIRLDDDGYVSNSVAVALAQLGVGTYYLSATVDEHNNYFELSARGLEFRVFKGVNAWTTTPSIKTWTEGQFAADSIPVAKAQFGTAIVTVTDIDGNIVYNSASATNTLSAVPAGTYTLTAYVIGTDDYTGMDLYTLVFQVFEKPGMPLWSLLVILFGSLLVIALVILVLFKYGVFQFLTDKVAVAISTKAATDATIAAVRANKKNEEAKQRAAEERRKEARRNANKQKKEMPLELQVAALEDKAKKAAERAEKMKARSEAMQLRAERMKERAEKQAAEVAEAAAAIEQAPAEEAPKAETPVTEAPVAEPTKAETPVVESTTETPAEEAPKAEQATAEEAPADNTAAEAAATDNQTNRRKKSPSKK